MGSPEPRRPGKAEQLAALASAAVMTWCMMPPQERMWARLRALHAAHRLAGSLARRAGRSGMADELAGRDLRRYQLACLLSRVRDLIGRELERGRP